MWTKPPDSGVGADFNGLLDAPIKSFYLFYHKSQSWLLHLSLVSSTFDLFLKVPNKKKRKKNEFSC